MYTATNLKELINSKFSEYKLISVSNRESYQHLYGENGKIEYIRPAGGVSVAMDLVMEALGGTLIAWGSAPADKEVTDKNGRVMVPPENPKYTLRRIWLNKKEVDGYYLGFSNQVIWPLCHLVFVRPKFEEKYLLSAERINKRFARAVLNEAKKQKALVMIQDYHLPFCSPRIKQNRPDILTAQFWHIPWPSPEIFMISPWRTKILEGLLANDLLGFQTIDYCDNFLNTVNQSLPSIIDRGASTVTYQGRTTVVKPFPIGVDFEKISNEVEKPEVDDKIKNIKRKLRLRNEFIALGSDRIDYTKGIPERLKAIDRFLEKYPGYQGKFVFIQIGAPSREDIGEYKGITTEIELLVDEINNKYPGRWEPIKYIGQRQDFEDLLAYFKMADMYIASSLQDGMHLGVLEYLAAKNNMKGIPILGEKVGASRYLKEALIINPYDIENFAEAIRYGMELPGEEIGKRVKRMRETIQENSIYKWFGDQIAELERIRITGSFASQKPQ